MPTTERSTQDGRTKPTLLTTSGKTLSRQTGLSEQLFQAVGNVPPLEQDSWYALSKIINSIEDQQSEWPQSQKWVRSQSFVPMSRAVPSVVTGRSAPLRENAMPADCAAFEAADAAPQRAVWDAFTENSEPLSAKQPVFEDRRGSHAAPYFKTVVNNWT